MKAEWTRIITVSTSAENIVSIVSIASAARSNGAQDDQAIPHRSCRRY
jgi:hypothetical protein